MEIQDHKEGLLVPYVPGDLTDDRYKDPSYYALTHYREKQDRIREDAASLKGFPKIREDFSRCEASEAEDAKTAAEDFYEKHREMLSQEYAGHKHDCRKKSSKLASPIAAAIKNFDLAKKLHKENLEHHPLPDTVTDAMYRKLQMQGAREPGLALKEGNYASGVAWKAYAGYGPTRCTKLRVFRPKTSVTHKIKDSANDRPSSVSSFDRKWRFIRQSKVTPIQLAVCWDLTPMDPKDEPKRTPHIDGSNGSLAPAVFSLVPSPKDGPNIPPDSLSECNEEPKCDGLHNSNNKLPYMYEPEICQPKIAQHSKTDSSTHSQRACKCDNTKTVQSAAPRSPPKKPHSSDPIHSSSSHKYCSKECYKRGNAKDRNTRLCVACEMKNVNIKDSRPKSEYKMAFKAGVPQKNYKRQDYPEHWRLATVYQHSYKPMQARKRPLLETVFK